MRIKILNGLWIPYGILTNENFNDKEKMIYSLILYYSGKTGYCTITNKFIGNIINLSDTRVSKLISSLSKKKYVKVITNFQDTARQIISRKIIPLVIFDNPTSSKTTNSIDNNNHNSSQNNTSTMVESNKNINNINNNYKNNNRFYSGKEFSEEELKCFYANQS